MDRNGIHVFVRVAGFALIAGVVLGALFQVWGLAIICGIAFLAIIALEVVTFVRRRRQIRDSRG